MAGYGTGPYGLGIYGIGYSPTVTDEPTWFFETPVVYEAYADWWPARITRPVSISLLKVNGSYRQVRTPTDDEVRASDIAYIGGGLFVIGADERDDLIEAGYGDLIYTSEETGYGLGIYGTGTYGA